MKIKINNKRILSIIVVFISVILFGGWIVAKAVGSTSTVNKVTPNLTIASDSNEYNIFQNQVGEFKFTVKPEPIPKNSVDKANRDKHIVLLVNTSRYMDGTKFSEQITSAKEFLKKFNGDSKTTFSIIEFNAVSKIKSKSNEIFKDCRYSSEEASKFLDTLTINNSYGENIGDAIRTTRLFYKNSGIKDNANIDKYMIMLTPNKPSVFSHSQLPWDSDSKKNRQQIGETKIWNWAPDNVKNKCEYFNSTNSDEISGTFWNIELAQYGDGTDPKGYAKEYANMMAQELVTDNIKAYFVGYSNSVDKTTISDIANKANGTLYFANDANELVNLYKAIPDVITLGYDGSGATVKINVPEGLKVYTPVAVGNSAVGWNSSATIALPNVNYRLDGDNYVADPIKVSVKFKAEKAGVFEDINSNGQTSNILLTYNKLDGKAQDVLMDSSIKVNVMKFNPSVAMVASRKSANNNGDTETVQIGSAYDLNYTLNVKSSDPANVLDNAVTAIKNKKIVVAIDSSITDKCKADLNMFVDKTVNSKTSLAIVQYSDIAECLKIDGKSFSNDIASIKKTISSLQTVTNKTRNTGDALRVSAGVLADGDENKSILLISGGNPTSYGSTGSDKYNVKFDEKIKSISIPDTDGYSLEYANLIAKNISERDDLQINLFGINNNSQETNLNEIITSGAGELCASYTSLLGRIDADQVLKGYLKPVSFNSNLKMDNEEEENKAYRCAKIYFANNNGNLSSQDTIKLATLRFTGEGLYKLHNSSNHENEMAYMIGNEQKCTATPMMQVLAIDNCKQAIGLYTNSKEISKVDDKPKVDDVIISRSDKTFDIANKSYFQSGTIIQTTGNDKYSFMIDIAGLNYIGRGTDGKPEITIKLLKIEERKKPDGTTYYQIQDEGLGQELTNKNPVLLDNTGSCKYLITVKGKIDVPGYTENNLYKITVHNKILLNNTIVKDGALNINVVKSPDLF
ncbi:von Willebrand factor type A domain-containing protein [Clostridium cavendishii DSM 21758]|uniref:von Willebrand factor type A domain-containing protein n=1 Tax=Clostridium cavendishii DSM 21758 TaxID=1121302 RepID=A0A1M6LIU7_9CLOT|nr:VWA domain-containing protein [Clostridium cavendishii]SHJ71126.1 von Willebrand factor type A domain-containing protein [Clostridium cavendishii DSM 21758]